MTTSFNLVTEPWITVNLANGSHDTVSLREIFSRSKEIRSIECDNPLQTAAVTRLVLAVMYRSMMALFEAQKEHTKNADVKLWKMLWDDKKNSLSDITSQYLSEWQSRFDLFDRKRPFFQIADLQYSSTNETSIGEPKHYLSKIMPDGELISVFRNSKVNAAVSYGEGARILITYQSWSTLAPLSPVVGIYPPDESAVPRLYPKGHRGWCSSIGVTMVVGRNLYETLMLNFVPSQLNKKDIPFWEERTARKVPVLFEMDEELGKPVMKQRNAKPVGQVQLFVWFAKSVRLVAKDGMIRSIVASENDSLSARSYNVHMARHHETQTAWRETENGEIAAYHFSGDSVWQNVPALIPQSREGFLAPLNVKWAAKVSNLLNIKLPARIRIIGASTDDRAQTLRGVIDKSVTVSSLARLDDPKATAALDDAAAVMIKLVRSNYYGFARDSLTARYNEIDGAALEALMLPANALLDDAFGKLFRNATSDDSESGIATTLTWLSQGLSRISKEVAEGCTPTELLGMWRFSNGEYKVFSIAALRSRLHRNLAPYYKEDVMAHEEEVGALVRWSIKKGAKDAASLSEVDRYVLDFWAKRKRLGDGSPSHVAQKNPYAFFKELTNTSDSVFDSRVNSLFGHVGNDELMESLRRLAGVITSKGNPLDFGTLAAMGTALSEPANRVYVAQKLVEQAWRD